MLCLEADPEKRTVLMYRVYTKKKVESAQNVEWSCNSGADVCFLFSRFGPIPASDLSAMQWQAEANMHYIRVSAVHIYGACCE